MAGSYDKRAVRKRAKSLIIDKHYSEAKREGVRSEIARLEQKAAHLEALDKEVKEMEAKESEPVKAQEIPEKPKRVQSGGRRQRPQVAQS